jgi:predicted DNA-binding protein
MVMGNRQDQQISVIGLTKRPTQVACAEQIRKKKRNKLKNRLFTIKDPLYSKIEEIHPMFYVRLPQELDQRLDRLAEKTKSSKNSFVVDALEFYLEAEESALIAIAEYEEQVRDRTLKTISLEEIKKELGFEDSDLRD